MCKIKVFHTFILHRKGGKIKSKNAELLQKYMKTGAAQTRTAQGFQTKN